MNDTPEYDRMTCTLSEEGSAVALRMATDEVAYGMVSQAIVGVLNRVAEVMLRDTAACDHDNSAETIISGATVMTATGLLQVLLTRVATGRMSALGEDEETAFRNAESILTEVLGTAGRIRRDPEAVRALADHHGQVAAVMREDIGRAQEAYARRRAEAHDRDGEED